MYLPDPDKPLEPYREYYEMLAAFSEEMRNQFSTIDITDPDKQSIIKRILRKSLIEPRSKTFFEGHHLNKYIIVEPAISIEDIEKSFLILFTFYPFLLFLKQPYFRVHPKVYVYNFPIN
ncbi:hypothetical protein [Chryseobacterium sp. BIGb0232]|uniref:hypothetical protein n=1 Tax=Chryseobacterium sp. BIGb0232 TaxID=2940598 RepID=UPI000F4722B7|nr:hypothetical protein [Chryseobacterium sp. BIGb0232]MCS4301051.1 hypothetical protein [Chryseobacterium sp. BIGb0232]ROS20085.1 hypothetical protein EDF65_0787 [Chryseobacterium nakagawai]